METNNKKTIQTTIEDGKMKFKEIAGKFKSKMASLAKLTIVIALIVAAFFAYPHFSKDLENMYKAQIQTAKAAVQDLCEYEVNLAKDKLSKHYNGSNPLPETDVDRLVNKSKGLNLDCFQLAGAASQTTSNS